MEEKKRKRRSDEQQNVHAKRQKDESTGAVQKRPKLTNNEKQTPRNFTKLKRTELKAANKQRSSAMGVPSSQDNELSSILSPELRNQLGLDDEALLVLPSKRAKKKNGKDSKLEEEEAEEQLSKNKKRKLLKLQEKKQRDQDRKKSLEILSKSEISKEQRELLRSSAVIGQRETIKEKIARAMLEKKMGIPLSGDLKEIEKHLNRAQQQRNDMSQQALDELYYDGNNSSLEVPLVPNEEQPSISPCEKQELKPIAPVKQLIAPQLEKAPEKPQINKTTKPKDIFMVLDFGLGSSSSSEKPGNQKTSLSSPRSHPKEKDEEDNRSNEQEDVNGIMEQDTKQQNDQEEEDNSQINEPMKRKQQDEEEKLSWKESVCKGFSDLIDAISSKVKDETAAKELILQANDLLDIVIPEDDSDQEEDTEHNITNNEDTSNIAQYPVVVDTTLVSNEPTSGEQDMKLINEMIEAKTHANLAENKKIMHTKFYMNVNRNPEIEAQRANLPICAEEQQIMETIMEHPIVIICGETGSGKTTQVPQFLFEAGFCDSRSGFPGKIGVTQPRRVAAVSTAKRVAEELNVEFGSTVSYQVRFDGNVNEATKIKFMTDGILIREIQTDPLLLQYSAIVIDEAHERNVNTDILIGWLSRFVAQRNKMSQESQKTPDGTTITPIKVIIMSATLRVEDFTKNERLFSQPPPVINITSRQFPVSVHFNKKTVFTDYVDSCFKKVTKIHEELPNGGILVFLTGKQEIDFLVDKLRKYAKKAPENKYYARLEDRRALKEKSKQQKKSNNQSSLQIEIEEEEEFIHEMGDLSDEELMETNDSDAEDEDEDEGQKITLFGDNIQDEKFKKKGQETMRNLSAKRVTSLLVMPLYSMLQPKEQLRVFEAPPNGARLCVIATNVAETSLTIPGIRYVIDSGRVKEKEHEKMTGVTKFVVKWTSKASADQRAGRAGRTGPGHCYRMYSGALFDQYFQQHSEPDILKTPIDNVVLQMKSMGIKNVIKFPFPTPPSEDALEASLRILKNISALTKDECITDLGVQISNFPVNPRYGKILYFAKCYDENPSIHATNKPILPYITAVVAAMTVQELFTFDHTLVSLKNKAIMESKANDGDDIPEELIEQADNRKKKDSLSDLERELQKRCLEAKKQWTHPDSDLLSALRAVGAYEYAGMTDEFCRHHMLHIKNMREAHKLRMQLLQIIQKCYDPSIEEIEYYESEQVEEMLTAPTREQEIVIRQMICTGFVDKVARLANEEDLNFMEVNLNPHNPVKPYVTQVLGRKQPAFIHPNSALHTKQVPFVCYNEIAMSQKRTKTFLTGVTVIHPKWLTEYGGPNLVVMSKPLDEPPAIFDENTDCVMCFVRPTYSEQAWELPLHKIAYPMKNPSDMKMALQLFVKLLLEVKIFKDLQPIKTKLAVAPSEILSKMSLSKRATRMIHAFQSQQVLPSKKHLREKWNANKNFLLAEFLEWVKPEVRKELESIWPPQK